MGWMIGFLIAAGLFFFTTGTIGLLRFPDVYTRTHSTTKCDTLGALLCIIALMLYNGWTTELIKLFLLVAFVWIANPTAAHLISRAALKAGIPVYTGIDEDGRDKVNGNF